MANTLADGAIVRIELEARDLVEPTRIGGDLVRLALADVADLPVVAVLLLAQVATVASVLGVGGFLAQGVARLSCGLIGTRHCALPLSLLMYNDSSLFNERRIDYSINIK
ncbi:hypothetical protein KI440_02015 [Candidatus Saccharibacteria bacterium TM7i]|nr:hypothetical protein KI440_02015 [Candidatus Saccharibacteria bacterium TM7i]